MDYNYYLQHYENIKKLFERQSPDLINWPDKPEFITTDKGTELMLDTNKQFFIDDLTTAIEKIGCHILMAIASRDVKDFKVLCAADPNEEGMFLVHLESNQHGIIDSIVIEFFTSAETMFFRINMLWNIYNEKLNGVYPYILLEQKNPKEIWNLFN